MKKLSVIGAGQMGAGIAQVAAQVAKIPQIILYDQSKIQLSLQMTKMKNSLSKATEKGTLTKEDEHRTLAAIKTSNKLTDLDGSDFVIEVNNLLKLKMCVLCFCF